MSNCLLNLKCLLEWTPQIYEDVAVMLSTCTDVYSADVPEQLREIAKSIRQDQEAKDRVSNGNSKDSAEWLNGVASGEHGVLFRKFMDKHGHRCVRDVSWFFHKSNVI